MQRRIAGRSYYRGEGLPAGVLALLCARLGRDPHRRRRGRAWPQPPTAPPRRRRSRPTSSLVSTCLGLPCRHGGDGSRLCRGTSAARRRYSRPWTSVRHRRGPPPRSRVRRMKQLASGVWRLGEFPRPTINVYLAGDVLIDAGRTWDRRRIFRQIADRRRSRCSPSPTSIPTTRAPPRRLREARHPARLPRRRRRRDGGPPPDPGSGDEQSGQPPDQGDLGRAAAPGGAGPARGRRGRRVPRRPRPRPRARRGDLLPRVGPGRDLRRRDPQHELRDDPGRGSGSRPGSSPTTPPRTAARSASSPSSSRADPARTRSRGHRYGRLRALRAGGLPSD